MEMRKRGVVIARDYVAEEVVRWEGDIDFVLMERGGCAAFVTSATSAWRRT